MFQQKVEELKKLIIEVADLVILMVENSVDGLLEKDNEKLEIPYNLEFKVNAMEIEIEEKCLTLIALHQPEAKNLRTILMIYKMVNDLERMGDLAVSIVKSSRYLIRKPFVKRLINIPIMAKETTKMLKNAINSFISEDIELAFNVCENDDTVDELKEQTYRFLVTYMVEDPTTIKRSIHINNISSKLERIADLCTNIAEETIFMTAGKVIKHKTGLKKEKLEKI